MSKPPRFVDYGPLFRKTEVTIRAREQAVRGTTAYKRKRDAITDDAARDTVPGDGYLRELERVLDSFEGFKRSDAQKDFHRAFITAVLPHIYGPADFERYGERIKRERGIDDMQQEVRARISIRGVPLDEVSSALVRHQMQRLSLPFPGACVLSKTLRQNDGRKHVCRGAAVLRAGHVDLLLFDRAARQHHAPGPGGQVL